MARWIFACYARRWDLLALILIFVSSIHRGYRGTAPAPLFRNPCRHSQFSSRGRTPQHVPAAADGRVRKLEEELGTALFVRGSRGVTLTPAGRTSLEIACTTLAQANRFAEAVRQGAAGERGGCASASWDLRPLNCCRASSRNIAVAIRRSNWCWKKEPALKLRASWWRARVPLARNFAAIAFDSDIILKI